MKQRIRMIDHKKFSYPAPFDAHYKQFRSDTRGDAIYIRKKHSKR